ncbi:hypothetical protein PATSB16_28860 [Pandoraea thiooxydans]|nr:hypothetical protein PATSB16_28860 [Pandoraea thiooxydans]
MHLAAKIEADSLCLHDSSLVHCGNAPTIAPAAVIGICRG